jgi:hypothetical protein
MTVKLLRKLAIENIQIRGLQESQTRPTRVQAAFVLAMSFGRAVPTTSHEMLPQQITPPCQLWTKHPRLLPNTTYHRKDLVLLQCFVDVSPVVAVSSAPGTVQPARW